MAFGEREIGKVPGMWRNRREAVWLEGTGSRYMVRSEVLSEDR
jgi:hypothetical protein